MGILDRILRAGEGKKLKALDQLQFLGISRVPLNQESVKSLGTLTQLQTLSLQATDLTPEWETELRAALPKAHLFISK